MDKLTSDAVESICKSFSMMLQLKLLEQFNDKYNKTLLHMCDTLITMIKFKEEELLLKMIRMNCESMRAALEYSFNVNSTYYETTPVDYSDTQLKNFKDALGKHLIHFRVYAEPYNVPYFRFNILIDCNCDVLKELFAVDISEGFIRWYNLIIKNIAHALYEILEWRIVHRYHIRFDVLMKFYARALKEILVIKISNMESGGVDPQDKPRRIECLMHKGLVQEINNYLQE